jgi:hypothetical protein
MVAPEASVAILTSIRLGFGCLSWLLIVTMTILILRISWLLYTRTFNSIVLLASITIRKIMMKHVLFEALNMTFSKSRLTLEPLGNHPSTRARVSNLRQPWRLRLFPVSTPAEPDVG